MPNRKSIQEALSIAIKTVESEFGGELVSLVHYGPTLELPFDKSNPNHEPIRLMLVLSDMEDESTLQRLGELEPEAMVSRQTDWVTLSERELVRSTDVFPVLFTEMKRRYHILSGKDILVDLDIREHHLRLRCEQQFKSLLFELQSDLHAKPKDVHQRLADQFLRFAEICSSSLLLLGLTPPGDTEEMLQLATEKLDLNFETVTQLKDEIRATKLLRKKCVGIQTSFISMVRKASAYIDQMDDEIIEVEIG